MASGITHILLMKELQNWLPKKGNLKATLAAARDFLQVGAIAPDLPYASIADRDFFLSTQSDLADKFHYEKTDEVPLKSLAKVRAKKSRIAPKELRCYFAFFVGYLSHIVADGLIHPFVRDKVGNYAGHQSEHRTLEMELDVLFYHYLNFRSGAPGQLNYSNIHDELMNLNEETYPVLPKIIKLFSRTIQDVYGVSYEPELIQGWIQAIHFMFAVAEGHHPAIYRNIGPIKSLLFKDYQELLDQSTSILVLTKPVDRDENFLGKTEVHFFNDIIPHFYECFVPIAQKAFAYVYEGGPALTDEDIPPINLDTGRLIAAGDNLDVPPALWT